LASAVALASIVLVATGLGGIVFALVWTVAALIVLIEWLRITGAHTPIVTSVGLLGVAASAALLTEPLFALAVLVVVAVIMAVAAPRSKLWALSAAPVAAVVALVPIAAYGLDRTGMVLILWLYAVVWGTDVGAYFAGRFFGGPKLWPRVSPKKTWSGAAGGTFAGALMSLLVIAIAGRPVPIASWDIATLLAVTFLLSAAAQAGDLAESALKRAFDVKDSGRLIPGHGGLMDRLDGFWAACVVLGCALFASQQD